MDFDKVKSFGNLELLAKQLVEGFITGLHKSPYHGFSVEFAEHSLFNPGESTRYIDWKVFAKTDRLYTKRFEEETNLRCMMLIDRSASMYYPKKTGDKINFSIIAAACLAYILQKQRDAVGLCVFSDKIEQITQVKSTATHIHHLFLQMQQLRNAPPPTLGRTALAEVIHEIAQRIHKRSLVIIFSDMMENRQKQEEVYAALRHLKHRGHEVLLFHLFHNDTELAFKFPNRPLVFVDVETGKQEKVNPAQVKKHYQTEINRLFREIKLRCGHYKIDFIGTDTQQGIDKVLLPYLAKRKKMR